MGFFTNYERLCKERKSTPTAVARSLGFSSSTVNRWRYGATPSGKILSAIAEYFGVSVDYLLGNTEIRNSPYNQSPKEIAQVALFGGDVDVTDEMWKEVEDFANYIVAKHKKNTNK